MKFWEWKFLIRSTDHIYIDTEYLDPPTCRKLGVWGLSKYSFSNMFWHRRVIILSEHNDCSMNTPWLWLPNSFHREGSIWSKNFHLRQLICSSFEQNVILKYIYMFWTKNYIWFVHIWNLMWWVHIIKL